MRVLCQANMGEGLPDNVRHSLESDGTRFTPLKIGAEYTVYGLMFRSNRVDYLVYPTLHDPDWMSGPNWKPGPLFKILDPKLPPWRICLTEHQPGYQPLSTMYGITALIGYDELVGDPQHYDGILDREPEHLQRFFVEKMKVDQWLREDES